MTSILQMDHGSNIFLRLAVSGSALRLHLPIYIQANTAQQEELTLAMLELFNDL